MSAFFHPSQDLLVSACLDQTIRIWDISGMFIINSLLSIMLFEYNAIYINEVTSPNI